VICGQFGDRVTSCNHRFKLRDYQRSSARAGAAVCVIFALAIISSGHL
jgi:hypothetical protein